MKSLQENISQFSPFHHKTSPNPRENPRHVRGSAPADLCRQDRAICSNTRKIGPYLRADHKTFTIWFLAKTQTWKNNQECVRYTDWKYQLLNKTYINKFLFIFLFSKVSVFQTNVELINLSIRHKPPRMFLESHMHASFSPRNNYTVILL